jgi:predicted ferric reductase
MQNLRRTKTLAVAIPVAITSALWLASNFVEGGAPLSVEHALTQLTSLVALTLMTIALLITTRSRRIELLYDGLDKSYRLHARVGEVAFVLVIVHVLTLIKHFSDIHEPLRGLVVPFVDTWPKTLGTLGFWMFVVLALLTYVKQMPYQAWLASHTWMGVPFVLSSIHAGFAISDIQRFEPIRFWMLLLVILGTLAWIYRTFFYRTYGPRYDYVVERVVDRGGGMHDLILAPTTIRMNYEPGKFAFISVKDHPEIPSEHHPFSIASSPVKRELAFSFRVVGDYTKMLPKLRKGERVEIYGPFGQFTLHRLGYHRRLILVAGGIGVTPFLSMLAFELTNNDYRSMWLFYSVRTEKDAVYDDTIAKQVPLADSHIEYVKWISEQNGSITAKGILEKTGPIDDYAVLLCGPPPMMKALKRQFLALGLPRHRIIFEDFAFR